MHRWENVESGMGLTARKPPIAVVAVFPWNVIAVRGRVEVLGFSIDSKSLDLHPSLGPVKHRGIQGIGLLKRVGL